MNGADFVQTAERLLKPHEDGMELQQSDLRSSASRAYYAAFHSSASALPTQFADEVESRRRSDMSHEAVIAAVEKWAKSGKPGCGPAAVIAQYLPRLKRARKAADYTLHEDFTVEQATESLKHAKIVLARTSDARRMQGIQLKPPSNPS